MSKRPQSVARTVSLALLAVTTALLIVFGATVYFRERTWHASELSGSLQTVTGQLAESLGGPLWNLELSQAGRIAESALLDTRVLGVVIRDPEAGGIILGRMRGAQGGVVDHAESLAGADRLIASRTVVFNGRPVGMVEAAVTTRPMKEALRRSLWGIAAGIAVLDALIFMLLTRLLGRLVFAPLRAVEEYAARVRAGGQAEAGFGEARFRGEMESLRATIATMVDRLSAAEKKYRDIVDNATEGVFQTTLDGRFLSANPAMAVMLGYDSPAELMARVGDIGAQLYYDAEERARIVETLLTRGACRDFRVRFLRRDGQTVWVHINARLVRDASGQPLYIEGTNTDITARMRAERRVEILNRHLKRAVKDRTRKLAEKAAELEAANVRLTELDRLKSAFLSTVSHDLRTPLTSIRGFAKLILRDFERSFAPLGASDSRLEKRAHRIQENLGIIENEGERLTRLINDFLDLSKIESGRAEWRDREVDPADLVGKAVDAVRGDFEGKPGLTLRVDLAHRLPPLFIDPDRLVQVMVNLLNNAVKFTETGEVRVRVHDKDGRLRLEVADTGVGIAPENLDKIFDKFHRAALGNTTEGRPAGTGLGLSICKNIVEHYGGGIWAESRPGKGSLFVVELPRQRAASSLCA